MIQRERGEQIAVIQWVRLNERRYPELALLFHPPNGGSRNVIEATNLKRMGVRSGIPDLILPVSRHGYHALYIEMKSGRGRVSAAQADMIERLKEYGNHVAICYDAGAAIDVIEWYLDIKPAKL